VPLTIIWFGIGNGSVIFVIANTIFFASLYNTVVGVQSIPSRCTARCAATAAAAWRCSPT
jgi:NitT/TauT family transport system permease protein/taurine transport system permease protein